LEPRHDGTHEVQGGGRNDPHPWHPHSAPQEDRSGTNQADPK
jgi:hypothetical protein